jgi:hypothetical protein
MAEIRLSKETIDFLCDIELPDLMENCGLQDPIFDDIARLLFELSQARENGGLAGILLRPPLY